MDSRGEWHGENNISKNLIYRVRNSKFKDEVSIIVIDPHGDFTEELLLQDGIQRAYITSTSPKPI